MGYLFQSLVQTNNYMFKKFQIKKIYAGVINRNNRSIRLIKRLLFQATGDHNKLEINGSIEELEIYSLNN